MPSFTPATPLGSVVRNPNVSASLVNSYSKVNTDRQSRYQARERRREGNWDILAIPTALLWLDDVCAVSMLEADQTLECAGLMADLWP